MKVDKFGPHTRAYIPHTATARTRADRRPHARTTRSQRRARAYTHRSCSHMHTRTATGAAKHARARTLQQCARWQGKHVWTQHLPRPARTRTRSRGRRRRVQRPRTQLQPPRTHTHGLLRSWPRAQGTRSDGHPPTRALCRCVERGRFLLLHSREPKRKGADPQTFFFLPCNSKATRD